MSTRGSGKACRPLVVVDMQPEFSAANDERTLREVCRAIKAARKRNDPVVVLEYNGQDDSHDFIRYALRGYDLQATRVKYEDDGSYEVARAFEEHGWKPHEILVCGVNIDFCVAETVLGLTEAFPGVLISILEEACNGQDEGCCHRHCCGRTWQPIRRFIQDGKPIRRLRRGKPHPISTRHYHGRKRIKDPEFAGVFA